MRISDWSSDVCSSDLLIDKIKADGKCDFMTAVAEPLPVVVFLKMLGLPLGRMEEYREIVSAHLSDPSPNPLDSIKRLWRIVDSIKDTLEDRRVNPQDRSEEHTSELQSLMRISY